MKNDTQQSDFEKEITLRLAEVIDPRSGKDILAAGFIANINGRDSEDGLHITLTLELPGGQSETNTSLMAQAKQAVSAIAGVARVTAVATEHNSPKQPSEKAVAGAHANPLGIKGKQAAPAREKLDLSGIKHIILVTSGKGGVGKSTMAANLAVALSQQGLSVGLMDADIYGPSIPTIMGLSERAPFEDGKIQPVTAHNVKCMSIGLLLAEGKALAWRGPMVMGAVQQLLQDVNWGSLDVMVIDTPPGTGDTHLTLLQKTNPSGAIIVSTPQEMALADVRRGVALFQKMNTPMLGLIENMSWLELPDGTKQKLFGEGGAEKTAKELDVPFLGAIPLYPRIAEASDQGTPIGATSPDAPEMGKINAIASHVITQLGLYVET